MFRLWSSLDLATFSGLQKRQENSSIAEKINWIKESKIPTYFRSIEMASMYANSLAFHFDWSQPPDTHTIGRFSMVKCYWFYKYAEKEIAYWNEIAKQWNGKYRMVSSCDRWWVSLSIECTTYQWLNLCAENVWPTWTRASTIKSTVPNSISLSWRCSNSHATRTFRRISDSILETLTLTGTAGNTDPSIAFRFSALSQILWQPFGQHFCVATHW